MPKKEKQTVGSQGPSVFPEPSPPAEASEPFKEEIPKRVTTRQLVFDLVADSFSSGSCSVCGSPKMVESWEQKKTGFRLRLCDSCQEALFVPLPVAEEG